MEALGGKKGTVQQLCSVPLTRPLSYFDQNPEQIRSSWFCFSFIATCLEYFSQTPSYNVFVSSSKTLVWLTVCTLPNMLEIFKLQCSWCLAVSPSKQARSGNRHKVWQSAFFLSSLLLPFRAKLMLLELFLHSLFAGYLHTSLYWYFYAYNPSYQTHGDSYSIQFGIPFEILVPFIMHRTNSY